MYMNFQSVLMFFIDGLSFIELDQHWTYYIMYKKVRLGGKKRAFSVVAFATVYDFWDTKPGLCRTRISQFMTLPPYQKQGFGSALLDVFISPTFTREYMVTSSRIPNVTK